MNSFKQIYLMQKLESLQNDLNARTKNLSPEILPIAITITNLIGIVKEVVDELE